METQDLIKELMNAEGGQDVLKELNSSTLKQEASKEPGAEDEQGNKINDL